MGALGRVGEARPGDHDFVAADLDSGDRRLGDPAARGVRLAALAVRVHRRDGEERPAGRRR